MSDWEHTSSVTNMLKILEWQTLEQHRAQAWVMMLYKIADIIVDINPSLYLQPAVVRSEDAMRFTIEGFAHEVARPEYTLIFRNELQTTK